MSLGQTLHLHVGQCQPDFSEDGAEEIQGDGKLEKESVDHHKVTNCHAAFDDLVGSPGIKNKR